MGAAARRLRALGTAARRRQPGLRMVARRRPCALGRRRGGDRTGCGQRRGSGRASWGRRRGGGRTGWRRRRGKAAHAARGWRRRRRGMAGGGIGRTAAARRAGVLIGPARHGKWAFVPCPGPDLRHVGRPGTARIIKRANRAGPNRAGPKSGPGRAVPGWPIGQLYLSLFGWLGWPALASPSRWRWKISRSFTVATGNQSRLISPAKQGKYAAAAASPHHD